MKPLSEKEWRDKLTEISMRIWNGDYELTFEETLKQVEDGLLDTILQDRKAWGEHNSKSAEAVNYMISVWDEVIPCWRDTPDHVQQKFIEVERQRNQGAEPNDMSEELHGRIPQLQAELEGLK